MLLFMRGINITSESFEERALREEMLSCLKEAEYYEKLAKEFHSKTCLDYGQKMLKRFYLLAETEKGSQILATTLFEKRGDLYEAILRHERKEN